MISPDLLFVYFVFAPFMFGNMAGWSSRHFFAALMTVVGVTVVLVGPWLLLEDYRFTLSCMAALWMFLGASCGLAGRSYSRIVGFRGYVFTLYPCLIGACLSELVTQAFFYFIWMVDWVETQIALWNYSLYLGILLVAMPFVGWVAQLPPDKFMEAMKKKAIYAFTFFGVLGILVMGLWQELIHSLMWWVPGSDPPVIYQIFFAFQLGFLASIPFYRSVSKHEVSGPGMGLEIAVTREDIVDNPPLESLIPFKSEIPEGWRVVHDKLFASQYNLRIKPPVSWYKSSTLDLVVFQYSPDESNIERLKRNARINLLAKESTIYKEWFGTRHGARSYECFFKRYAGYGFLVTFVIQHNEFVVHWFSSDPKVFRQYLPDVEAFIEGLRFDVSK